MRAAVELDCTSCASTAAKAREVSWRASVQHGAAQVLHATAQFCMLLLVSYGR